MSDSELEVEKKRKTVNEDMEDAPAPVSKKQKRLEKKGKKESSKSKTKKRDSMDDLLGIEPEKENKKDEAKGNYGVWIGNMTFDTTEQEIRRFIIAKTSHGEEDEMITDEAITRVNMPMAQGRRKNKGFAYVDFDTEEQQKICIGLSEQNLNGRNLLIKSSKSFEGRPAPGAGKNPPSRILFVGNLSFDTTDAQLEMHFQHCGEIVKIRMATFEDSGNCKGFSFVDFLEIESATKALQDKRCRKLNGRMLRMEYGEDRSKRTREQKHGVNQPAIQEVEAKPEAAPVSAPEPVKKQRKDKFQKEDRRPKPGLALASAQRGKVGIVESAGKKMTFDD